MPLHVYQSTWGMQRLPWKGEQPWTLDEQLDRIVDAGFDGISVPFVDVATASETCRQGVARGLRVAPMCFPTTVEGLTPILEAVEAIGRDHVDHVNLQPNVRPVTVEEGVPYITGWLDLAADAGVPTYIETHRDRMTTDLLFTLQLMDAVPAMRLTADLSHLLLGREFPFPVSEENHALISRVLERSRAYHGRVASREQVQIQISFPHHKPWVDLFAGWWLEGFRAFRATAPDDEILTFTCELGPPNWYAITGPDGDEQSDRWEEALQMAALARDLWEQAAT